MNIRKCILFPAQFFNIPDLNTPLSTIPIPHIIICMTIICSSFFLIVGGFIYCVIRGIEFIPYDWTPDGKMVPVYIAAHYEQTGIESLIIGSLFTLGGLTLLCGFIGVSNINKKTSKKRKEDEKDVFSYIALTSFIWIAIAILIFTAKMGYSTIRFTAV